MVGLTLLLLLACTFAPPEQLGPSTPTPIAQSPLGEGVDHLATFTPPTNDDAPALRYDPLGPDRDCEDFENAEELLVFFAAAGPDADPHNLDEDRDGIPCDLGRGAD